MTADGAQVSAFAGEPPLTLGTAGHIDHGKTALVTLLTGKNTDRLTEERERGISIELGYAELALPSGRRLSVVDVPGHERFVRTMVAGATGIDLFLLVVAADDGVMPQTVEHIAILELLGVPRGVVALTKADLVDDELLELVRDDVERFLVSTAYAGTPVIPVSARDGRGVPALLGALEETAAEVGATRAQGPARLPIDRVFPLKGRGTVVTGTLWRGEIRPGDAMLIEPGGRRVTVRSVQVHDHPAEVARAGQRAGVNVRGAEREELRRGDWLVAPARRVAPTRALDGWIRLLPSARPLKSGAELRLHHGTTQTVARLSLIGAKQLEPGAEAAARVRFKDELVVEAHDRFILRALSPVETEGGGLVLDPVPRRWHDRARWERFLRALKGGKVREAVVALAEERGAGGLTADDLAPLGVARAAARAVLAEAEAAGEVESLAACGALGEAGAGSFEDEGRRFAPGTCRRSVRCSRLP